MKKGKPRKPGPKPDKLKIDGDWQEAMKKGVNKRKPSEGSADGKKSES